MSSFCCEHSDSLGKLENMTNTATILISIVTVMLIYVNEAFTNAKPFIIGTVNMVKLTAVRGFCERNLQLMVLLE